MNNKRKVFFLITGLQTGGAEMIVYRFLQAITKNNYADQFEFKVISIVPPAEIGDKIKNLGIEVMSLNAKSKLNPLVAWKLYFILKKQKPDILHTFLFHANILGRIIGKLAGTKHVISAIRNEYFGNILREKLIKLTRNWCDYTTVVSQYTANKMIKKNVINKNKYKVITNGVNIEELTNENQQAKDKIKKELKLKKGDPILIGVGSLTKQKGFSYLIEAVNNLTKKYPDIVLMILGSGPLKDDLKQIINRLNLQQNIKLLGRRGNVKDYLQLSDIFVLSSLWEGMPNALLEAQAVGTPSVATNVSGVQEIIEENKNGLIVESKSTDSLLKGIVKILDKTINERRKMQVSARKKIKKEFSVQIMAKEYVKLYNKFE